MIVDPGLKPLASSSSLKVYQFLPLQRFNESVALESFFLQCRDCGTGPENLTTFSLYFLDLISSLNASIQTLLWQILAHAGAPALINTLQYKQLFRVERTYCRRLIN